MHTLKFGCVLLAAANVMPKMLTSSMQGCQERVTSLTAVYQTLTLEPLKATWQSSLHILLIFTNSC